MKQSDEVLVTPSAGTLDPLLEFAVGSAPVIERSAEQFPDLVEIVPFEFASEPFDALQVFRGAISGIDFVGRKTFALARSLEPFGQRVVRTCKPGDFGFGKRRGFD